MLTETHGDFVRNIGQSVDFIENYNLLEPTNVPKSYNPNKLLYVEILKFLILIKLFR